MKKSVSPSVATSRREFLHAGVALAAVGAASAAFGWQPGSAPMSTPKIRAGDSALRGGAGWMVRMNPHVIEATRSLCLSASSTYVDQEHRENMAYYLTHGLLDFGVVPGALTAAIPGYLAFHGIHGLPAARLHELRSEDSELSRLWREASNRYGFRPFLLSPRVGSLVYFRRADRELRPEARIATSVWTAEGLAQAGLRPVQTRTLGELREALLAGAVDATDAMSWPVARQLLTSFGSAEFARRWELVTDSAFFPSNDFHVLFAGTRWSSLTDEMRDRFSQAVVSTGAGLEKVLAARDAEERRLLSEKIRLVPEEPSVVREFQGRSEARLQAALALLRA